MESKARLVFLWKALFHMANLNFYEYKNCFGKILFSFFFKSSEFRPSSVSLLGFPGGGVQFLSWVQLLAMPRTAAPQAVLHNALELAQNHVHWVSDAIDPSQPLPSPSPPALSLSQHQVLFQWVGFLYPGGSVVKNPTASAGDIRNVGSIPGLGRCPGEGNGSPLQYSCLENSKDRGAWWATVHGVTKGHIHWWDKPVLYQEVSVPLPCNHKTLLMPGLQF